MFHVICMYPKDGDIDTLAYKVWVLSNSNETANIENYKQFLSNKAHAHIKASCYC